MTIRTDRYRSQVESVLASYEEREANLLRLFGQVMGFSFVKPDDYTYRLDGFSPQGNRAVWAEVKCREFPHDKYEYLRFDLDKVLRGIQMYQLLGHEFWLLAEFSDGVRLAYRYEPDHAGSFKYETEGRLDRSDWEKIKPMCAIPRRLFVRWGQGKAR